MASADLRRGSDDQHQPLRNDLLFAGRPARLPRDRRSDLALSTVMAFTLLGNTSDMSTPIAWTCCRSIGISWMRCGSSCSPSSTSSGDEDGLERMELESQAERTKQRRRTSSSCLRPTAWPIVLAFGVDAGFAGLVTSASVSVLGAILRRERLIGWFRDVLPHEKHRVGAGCGSQLSRQHQPSRGRPRRDRSPRAAPGAAAPRDLSGLGRRERRPRGKRGHGGAGDAVRVAERHGIWYPINLLAAGFFPAQ